MKSFKYIYYAINWVDVPVNDRELIKPCDMLSNPDHFTWSKKEVNKDGNIYFVVNAHSLISSYDVSMPA
mgnify:CR=1 FL=1